MLNLSFLSSNNKKNEHKFKIYLTGADSYHWALSEDYKQTIKATKEIASTVSLRNSEIIHSVYWETLQKIPTSTLEKKTVICNLSGAWERYESNFGNSFLNIADKVNIWVARSHTAEKELKEKGKNVFLIPYTVNTKLFRPLPKEKITYWREKLKIPKTAYVIGNFMRDSTADSIISPKLVKGPDIFADIVTFLYQKKYPVHILLAGPRRHWIRKILDERGIPYSYAGYRVCFNDMRINTLNRNKLNMLYNILDLSLVTSRSEAGPHAILEAAAAQCPQASTKVGIAPDILPTENIYETVEEGVKLIEKDIKTKFLQKNTENIYNQILTSYTPEAVTSLYKSLYERAINL